MKRELGYDWPAHEYRAHLERSRGAQAAYDRRRRTARVQGAVIVLLVGMIVGLVLVAGMVMP